MNPGDLMRLGVTQTLAQNRLQTLVSKVIHGKMFKIFKFDHTNKWYMHNTLPVPENDT